MEEQYQRRAPSEAGSGVAASESASSAGQPTRTLPNVSLPGRPPVQERGLTSQNRGTSSDATRRALFREPPESVASSAVVPARGGGAYVTDDDNAETEDQRPTRSQVVEWFDAVERFARSPALGAWYKSGAAGSSATAGSLEMRALEVAVTVYGEVQREPWAPTIQTLIREVERQGLPHMVRHEHLVQAQQLGDPNLTLVKWATQNLRKGLWLSPTADGTPYTLKDALLKLLAVSYAATAEPNELVIALKILQQDVAGKFRDSIRADPPVET